MGRNSLKVMCWKSATLMCRVSWKIVSSLQCGLRPASCRAIRLWFLIMSVCSMQSTVCSLTRGSPVRKQKTSSEGRMQPSSGSSSDRGSRSSSPRSLDTATVVTCVTCHVCHECHVCHVCHASSTTHLNTGSVFMRPPS